MNILTGAEGGLTPERAREVVEKQSHWPFWGNYSKFMTPEEVEDVMSRVKNHPSGNVSVASVVHGIARGDAL